MINKINLLKNVGPFDNVSPHPDTAFGKLTLIYGENGRGKTTLANIFRSLGSNKASLIEERQRLGSVDPPHIEIEEENGTLFYTNGNWLSPLPNIAVFDDNFVVQNVCAGMEVSPEHRKNLHELIIGEDGAILNREFQLAKAKIDEHNRAIREIGAQVKSSINGDMSVDIFCKLPPHPDIEKAISDIKKSIKTAESKDVKNKNGFDDIGLPALNIGAINTILQKDLLDLEQDAENMVKAHFLKLGEGAQDWVSDGANKFEPIYSEKGDEICPFCAQNLEHSPLINHYKDYFSSAYNDLKAEITDFGNKILSDHKSDVRLSFKLKIQSIKQIADFWKEHIDIPNVDVDVDEIVNAWEDIAKPVISTLRKKASAPLEKMTLSEEVMTAVAVYENHRQRISDFSGRLQGYNMLISKLKEQLNVFDLKELLIELAALKITQKRYNEDVNNLCKAYLTEEKAKEVAEKEKNNARKKLDLYSEEIFEKYQDAINLYLKKFLADFRLMGMKDINTGGRKFCTYKIKINGVSFSVPPERDEPLFKNTLSAGDRNALALAFFFASLDKDVALAEKIVIIDDPMTSLDRHRRSYTIKHIVALEDRVKQVILLSHSGYFLYKVWKAAVQKIKNTPITSLQINHSGTGSNLTTLDICNKFVEKHMQRRKMISEYINSPNPDKKSEVTSALRPMLEDFLSIAYPESFSGKTTLGVFIGRCRKAIPNNIILNQSDVDELTDLNDYAIKFHHTSELVDPMEEDSDIELIDYCNRVLSFTRRPIKKGG